MAGNWTFRAFLSSPHWTYSTFPQQFLLIQLQAKHVFRRNVRDVPGGAVRCFVTPLINSIFPPLKLRSEHDKECVESLYREMNAVVVDSGTVRR